ncbi:MAG: hypothetical protein ACE15D_13225 [Candidatus Eisenbacteria bacterium]
MIDQRVADRIGKVGDELSAKGELLASAQLVRYCVTFRSRFGPEVLAGLDGEKLLETMHDNLNRDSLVYWLEFKNGDEFPARSFRGIAGGSALEFGIYGRRKSGAWMTGSPQKQEEIPLDQAIEIARQHPHEFRQGAELLAALPRHASDGDYRELQKKDGQSSALRERLGVGAQVSASSSPTNSTTIMPRAPEVPPHRAFAGTAWSGTVLGRRPPRSRISE